MGDPVALQDIKGRVTGDSDESAYDLPITSSDEENVYTNIASSGETLADLTTTEAKSGDIHVSKPEAKTVVSKKLYIFFGVLLTMLVILSVALGVITHILMMRTGDLEAKSEHASKMAAIEANQRRMSELRLNHLEEHASKMAANQRRMEDGLNCTCGPWSLFSPCTATCGLGLQYRERSCDSSNPDLSEHWCSRSETEIESCCYGLCKQVVASDCKDIQQNNVSATDGVYLVSPNGTCDAIEVYCDMTTDGGGWTVFQKRFNGSVDFNRGFNEYENGFGSVYGEFWLGLKYIYEMTKDVESELRIDMVKSTEEKGHATYQSFSISGPSNYSLHIGTYSGTAGDGGSGLSYNNGYSFSTHDRDSNNCAEIGQGGWWYKRCTYSNLNGLYVTPGTKKHYAGGGVVYYSFDQSRSLKSTEMKFRRKD